MTTSYTRIPLFQSITKSTNKPLSCRLFGLFACLKSTKAVGDLLSARMVYNSTHGVLSMLRVHGKQPIVPGIQAGKNSEGGSCIRGNTRMQRNLPASM